MSIIPKKKHKSVKFDSKDLKLSNDELPSDNLPRKESTNIDNPPSLLKSEKLTNIQNENQENSIPIEKNPFIKSAFGKLFNRYHMKKSLEKQDTEKTETKSILKSLHSNDTNEGELKNMLSARNQFGKNLKVKDTLIDKNWLKSKPNTYDVILLNAFYLIDIKRNLQKTKESEKENVFKIQTLENEVMKITDHGILPKTHYPVISENERSLYLHDPKTSYLMQKKSRILGLNLVRDAQISNEGLVQNKNNKKALENDSIIIGKLEERSDSITTNTNEKHLYKSESKLKWLSDKKFQNYSYRVVFEGDNPKQNHAIYLSEWKEALKIRDFSIVSAIGDKAKNQSLSPKDFMKYFASQWKAIHAYKLMKLMKIYLDEEMKDREEMNKLLKKDQEKKMERDKVKEEILKKKKIEEELRKKELQKINFLKKSDFLQMMTSELLQDFTHYWFALAKNIQTLYLKSKPVLTEINFDLILSFDYLEISYKKKRNLKPVILLKISKNQKIHKKKNEPLVSEEVICDTSIFTNLSKMSSNSAFYFFNQSEENWESFFDLNIRNIYLSQEFLESICVFKIFDQISLKEVGKIEIPFKNLINITGNIKAHTLFFDLGTMVSPDCKAILHLKSFKKTYERAECNNFDTFVSFLSETQNSFIDPIYGYSYDLNLEEKHHLKILYEIFNKIKQGKLFSQETNTPSSYAKDYSMIKDQYFSLFLNKISESIAISNKNISDWTHFLEELVAFQAEINSEIGEQKSKEDKKFNPNEESLIVTESFIERHANIHENSEDLVENPKMQIFSSIFYQIHEWEKTPHGIWFYKNLQKLCKEGIPFVLREVFWLEFGKAKKLVYYSEKILRQNNFIKKEIPQDEDPKKTIYEIILINSKNYESLTLKDFFEDLDEYISNGYYNLALSDILMLKNIFQSIIFWKSLLVEKKVLYSKELISIVIKIIRFYKAERKNASEENVFWLFLNLLMGCLNHYYCSPKEVPDSFMTLTQNGIKSDLFILDILMQEHLPDVYRKIEEYGVPISHFVCSHFLSLFSDIFNQDLCYRIWDILLLESGSSGQVKSSWILIITAFLLFKRNSDLIVKSKNPKDIEFIFKIYGTYEFDSDSFIQEIYNYINKFFIKKESNPSNHFIGSIKYVGENLCKDLIQINLDEELKNYYQELKNSYYSDNLAQNHLLSKFKDKIYNSLRKKYGKSQNDLFLVKEVIENLSKFLLSENSKTLKATNNRSFQEKNYAPVSKNQEDCLKPALLTSIHLYIHEISLMVNEIVKIKIKYNELAFETYVNTNNSIDIYEIMNYREGKNIIRIEIFQKEFENETMTHFHEIHINILPLNTITKEVTSLRESNRIVKNGFQSIIGYSILINSSKNSQFLNPFPFKTFKYPSKSYFEFDLKYAAMNPNKEKIEELRNEIIFAIYHEAFDFRHDLWKMDSYLSMEDFTNMIINIFSIEKEPNPLEIFNFYKQMHQNNSKLSLCDYIINFVLFLKISCREKLELVFDVLTLFYNRTKINAQLPLRVVISFVLQFYDTFLFIVPKEKLINLIEFHSFDTISCITEANFFSNELNENLNDTDAIDLKEFMNSFMNEMFSQYGNKCIWLDNNSNFILCLNEFLKNLINVQKGGFLVFTYKNCYIHKKINKEMIYENGMLIFKEDSKMRNLKENNKLIELILNSNNNLLEISNHEIMFSKNDFLKILFKLPLFKFLLSSSLKNSDYSTLIKNKKKGVLLQISIDSNEIARLRIAENEENEGENKVILNEDLQEAEILQEWEKFSKILVDYLKKNTDFHKERDTILENLMRNPIVEIDVNINSFNEKLHSFLQMCIFKFIKHMNKEIDEQINKNESLIRMNELLLLEAYSNFENIDFANNEYTTYLVCSKNQKEMDQKLSLFQNIQNLAYDFFLKDDTPFYEIILNFSNVKTKIKDHALEFSAFAKYINNDLSIDYLPCKILNDSSFDLKSEEKLIIFLKFPTKLFIVDKKDVILKNLQQKKPQKYSISNISSEIEEEKNKLRDSKKKKTMSESRNDEVLNEIPIKLANEHLKIEEESDKKKMKENLFILLPPRTSILKNKKPKYMNKS